MPDRDTERFSRRGSPPAPPPDSPPPLPFLFWNIVDSAPHNTRPPVAPSLQRLLSTVAAACGVCVQAEPPFPARAAPHCVQWAVGAVPSLWVFGAGPLCTCVSLPSEKEYFCFSQVHPREGVLAPHEKCVFNFMGNGPAIFRGGRPTLIALQQSTGCLPAVPTPGHGWGSQAVPVGVKGHLAAVALGVPPTAKGAEHLLTRSLAAHVSSFVKWLFGSFAQFNFLLPCMGSVYILRVSPFSNTIKNIFVPVHFHNGAS